MASEGKINVIMLTRSRLYLYDGSNVLALDLPASIVRDLDVKDRDGLFNLLVTFIQKSKLLPAQIYFVLAESVCFTKDFTVGSADQDKANELIQEYIEEIPFTNVLSKVYKTPTTWRVIGVNQDLIDTVFEAFGSRGFGLSAIVPASIFPDLALSTDLTAKKAQIVLNKKDVAIGSSLVGERTAKDQELVTTQTAVPKNKVLPYLLIAFAVLFIVLAVMMYLRFKG